MILSNIRHFFRNTGIVFGVAALAALPALVTSPASSFAGSATATYTATQTIPVPPASNYAGSGGGDGWAVAVGTDKVFNVFHHQPTMKVACHLQSDASECWSPKTVTDGSGNNFATQAHPGLWLDLATNKLYVYGSRSTDETGGVVCIDTTSAAANPFCGFTALTAPGEAPVSGMSAIGAPVLVGQKWYAFNYNNGSAVTGSKNKLLCFDTASHSACAAQPFSVNFGAGTNGDTNYPTPGISAIGNNIVLAGTFGGAQRLACFNPATIGNCAGSWPAAISGYVSSYGAPYPLLSTTGAVNGVCLPTGADPCFSLSGTSVATPSGMAGAITGTSGWNGAAFVLGPRVYVPNGNTNAVNCYDASTNASCANFPKALTNLYLLYSVNRDPQRPTCLWVNADGGSSQIQSFDAYTGNACGEGAIRVLAASFVTPSNVCEPATYTSLQVLAPARNTYTSGSIAFQDIDANPIPSIPDATLDNNGSIDLSGLNLSTALGLPQFLLTLKGGSSAPQAVTVKLTWTGTDDPSCVGPGVTKVSQPVAPTTSAVVAPTTTATSGKVTPVATPISAKPTYTG